MSARERGEAEARRLIAIIDRSRPGPRDRYRDLKSEAGSSGILASKALLDGFTDVALEQAAAASLLADTAYAAARGIRHSAEGAGRASAPMSAAPLTPLQHNAPRLTP